MKTLVSKTIAFGMLVLSTACSPDRGVTNPDVPPPPLPPPPPSEPSSEQVIACSATLGTATMSCGGPGATSPGMSLNVIVGGPQGLYVQLTPSGTALNAGTFTSSVTIQNRMAQPMGTADGSSADTSGIRVVVTSGPTVTSGSGTVSVVPDGTGTVTAGNQAFYRYGGMLQPDATSAPKPGGSPFRGTSARSPSASWSTPSCRTMPACGGGSGRTAV